jgi:hypothetical protein
VPRREVVRASFLFLLCTAGCATTGSPDSSGRDSARAPARNAGYQVREAAETADTDGLEISLQHGVIRQEAAQEAVMRRWPDLTRCYGEAGPAMGFAAGAVTLRFVVDPRGATAEVRVTESQLGNFEAERCLLSVGRTIQFPRPLGNASATVDYTLEFRSTGDIPVVELPPGTLDPDLPSLFAHLHTECGRLGADEVQATLYMDAAGAVRSVGLAATSALDDEAARCISAAIRGWAAPRASAVQGGGVGRLLLPLRTVDLTAHREQPPEVRRYSRASATARARRDRRR